MKKNVFDEMATMEERCDNGGHQMHFRVVGSKIWEGG